MAAGSWNTFYGGYYRDPDIPGDVMLCGSPENVIPTFNVPLGTAHAANSGYGIRGVQDADGFSIEVSLVGAAISGSTGQYMADAFYTMPGAAYNWKLLFYTSKNNGSTWELIYEQFAFQHIGGTSLLYRDGWQATISNWSGRFFIPDGTTHLKAIVQGERATFPYEHVWPITQFITDYKPWAIRKSGTFRTFTTLPGYFNIRKSGRWTDISKMQTNESEQPNVGHSRIRKSNTWIGQKQVGS